MSYRVVRFEYYHVVFRKNDDNPHQRDRLFELVRWMDKANKKSLEGRTYDYHQERARLERAYWDDELSFFYLHFARLRDTNIPSTATVDKVVVPLELDDNEYLGEEVSALYDDQNHVLMLQRNRYSLGPEGIEEYLNLLWDNENETIYLRPISPPDTFSLVRQAKEYRKINIRLADIPETQQKKLLSKLKSPLKGMINSYREYKGKNAQVLITVGNGKGSLDPKTVSDTLDDLQSQQDLFSKAEIAKKDDEDAKVELIDLFSHKAHDITSFRMEHRETLNHYAIAQQMYKIYSPAKECDNRQADIVHYIS